MKRYCKKCQKEFEFDIDSMKDLDSLVCPECGSEIDKESRRPVDPRIEENEEKIGRMMFGILGFNYMFFLVFATIGVVSYFLEIYPILYFTTAVNLIVYLAHILGGSTRFKSGILFIPVGAALFYLFYGTIESACLGVQVVFIIRHIIRDVLYTSIIKLARWGGRN